MFVPGVTVDPATSVALAEAVGGPTTRFSSKQRLSTLCDFFADEARMVVVVGDGIDQVSADKALAWGLAHRGDRELSLVLPEDRAFPTLVRVPWLAPPVRVFTHAAGVVSEPPPMTEKESIDTFTGGVRRVEVAALGDKADWIGGVIDWASVAPRVDRVERPKYVAWHVAGRQVLKVTPTAKGLNVVAGVVSTKPDDWDPIVQHKLTAPAEDHVQHALIAAASKAASNRLAGDDAGHREHRLQAALQPERLGLEPGWRREFPARRPGSDRAAFIDFLAKDPVGRVHVVETKIGPDEMLVLQGLDYWLWCRANTDHIGGVLDAGPGRPPVIDFVVAPKLPGGEPISIYTAAQAEALHRDIEWRFTVVDDADTAADLVQFRPYTVPSPHRRADDGPRWSVRLQERLVAAAAEQQVTLRHGHSFTETRQALLAEAMPAYEHLASVGLLHDYVTHVRSSQAFALNLLAPLSLVSWTEIARHHLGDPDAHVTEAPTFEYTDPDDALAEATKASPHQTQVDCLLRIQTGTGRTHLMLIEVKLSEDNFSTCSAYSSSKNPRRHICAQPGPFGADAHGCFQLCNHDREHRRRYDHFLGEPAHHPASFGCWFRDGANQVMRNVALARALVARGEAASASMLLMAPDDHATIWEQWRRHISLLQRYDDITFGDLPASQVVAHHPSEQAHDLASRYLLPDRVLDLRLAQQLVDSRFPDGTVLNRLHSDGTLNYQQALERLAVIEADDQEIVIQTWYPAGPFTHRIPRSKWEQPGDITIPDPNGSSRTLSADLTTLTDPPDADGLARRAHQHRLRKPWWTAPIE